MQVNGGFYFAWQSDKKKSWFGCEAADDDGKMSDFFVQVLTRQGDDAKHWCLFAIRVLVYLTVCARKVREMLFVCLSLLQKCIQYVCAHVTCI